jgi:hypothetical protein
MVDVDDGMSDMTEDAFSPHALLEEALDLARLVPVGPRRMGCLVEISHAGIKHDWHWGLDLAVALGPIWSDGLLVEVFDLLMAADTPTALDVGRQTMEAHPAWPRSLAMIAKRCNDPSLVDEALLVARGGGEPYRVDFSLSCVASEIADWLPDRALDIAAEIPASYDSIAARVAVYLASRHRERASILVSTIAGSFLRQQAQGDIACSLARAGHVDAALAIARDIQDGDVRAPMLAEIATSGTDDALVEEALSAARSVSSDFSRAKTLASIASRIPRPSIIDEALDAFHAIVEEAEEVDLELELHCAPTADDRRRALKRALDGGHQYFGDVVLNWILATLTDDDQDESVRLARSMMSPWLRVKNLALIAARLRSLPIAELAVAEASQVTTFINWSSGIELIACAIAEVNADLALEYVLRVADDEERGKALGGTLGRIALVDPMLAVSTARSIEAPEHRARALAKIVANLPSELRTATPRPESD